MGITPEVKVILRNHGQVDCSFKAGDQIAQLIVERIADANIMEVEDLGTTEREKKGFRSCNINPKGSIIAKEEEVQICLLYADTSYNEFFRATDMGYHLRLIEERAMLSNAHINAALTRRMNDSFLEKIGMAGKAEEKWQERGRELVRLRDSGKEMPNEEIEKDGLLYYQNLLYIPKEESLQTEIAQGCHDSLVAGHLGQEKTIAIIRIDFYWKGLAEWTSDYLRSCDECQRSKSHGLKNTVCFNLWKYRMLPGAAFRPTLSRNYRNLRRKSR